MSSNNYNYNYNVPYDANEIASFFERRTALRVWIRELESIIKGVI